jgi:hypothetical protein
VSDLADLSDDSPEAFRELVASLPADDDAEAWAAREAVARAAAAADVRRSLEQRARLLAEKGFPLAALDDALSPDLDLTCPPLARASRWNPADHPLLALAGSTGIGKTVAAAWWALHCRVPGMRFVRATTFARLRGRAHQELLDAGGLVLDDLGEEPLDRAGVVLANLGELVDVFYQARKPLLVTSNLRDVDVAERYSERIASRWRQRGRWAEFGGAPSLRPPPTERQGRLV